MELEMNKNREPFNPSLAAKLQCDLSLRFFV